MERANDILKSVQQNYPAINVAAGQLLEKLSGTDIKRDMTLAAELAGLMLLRAPGTKLPTAPSGMAIIGVVSEEGLNALHNFAMGVAMSNGLDARGFVMSALPADAKKYLPEVSRFEKPLVEICVAGGVKEEHYSFVAAASAVKLVLAGNQLRLLDGKIGMAMVHFHLIAGCKTIPFPVEPAMGA